MGYELDRATMEAGRNAAEDAYFEARPQIDCNDRRKVFDAGYNAASESLRRQLAESQATNCKLRELLDEIRGDINPERGYADDTENEILKALALPNDATALNELIAERTKELTAEVERLASAINRMFEEIPPYRDDGSCTIPDSVVDYVVKAMHETGNKFNYEVTS